MSIRNAWSKVKSAFRALSIKDVIFWLRLASEVVGQMKKWQQLLPESGLGEDRKRKVLEFVKDRIKDFATDEQDQLIDMVGDLIEAVVSFSKLRGN